MATDIERLPDGSASIPVLEEELVVTRSRRVRERLIVRRKVERREERIEADLRRERVELEAVGDVVLDPERARPAEHVAPGTGTVVAAALTRDDVPELRNLPVITLDGVELGHVGDVWYDEATGAIHTVGVAGDALGLRRVELPAANAVLRPDALQLAHTRAELAELDRPQDAALARDPEGVAAPAALTRHEEELGVGARAIPVGAVRARKTVDVEHVAELLHRDVEHYDAVERMPVEGDDDGAIRALEDGAISIPLFEEVVEVTKRPVVRERVLIEKQVDVDTFHVRSRLRRERVDVDGSD